MRLLFYNVRFEKGKRVSVRNSPVDCFVARVHAGERVSEAGESRRLRQRRHGLCIVRGGFFIKASPRSRRRSSFPQKPIRLCGDPEAQLFVCLLLSKNTII